jgi:outer membrane protein TolC
MTPDFRKQLQAILDAHDDAFRALRAADDAVGDGNGALRLMIDAQARTIEAHRGAIDAALAANRAALDLLNHLEP